MCSSTVVSHNLAQATNHIPPILIAHPVKHRQADQALVSVLRDGILASQISEAIAIVGMAMHGNVVNVHANVLRPQLAENLSSIGAQFFEIEPDGIKMPRRVHTGPHPGKCHSRKTAER